MAAPPWYHCCCKNIGSQFQSQSGFDIERIKTKSRKSCLSNKGKLHMLCTFASVDWQRWLLAVARKQMEDITEVKKRERIGKGIRCLKMGSRVDWVNETAQLKAGKKKPPTARSVARILKNCRVFPCPGVLSHGAVMQCYIYNSNRRIFQVTWTEKMCEKWLVRRNMTVYFPYQWHPLALSVEV